MKRFVPLLLLAGCVETRDPIKGTQSLKIDLVSPSPGSLTQRLGDTQRKLVVNITALDADGKPDASFNNTLQVYVNFLGTLTPYLGGMPLASVPMSGGAATNVTIDLPPVFGPTTLWFDDGQDMSPTYASGASDVLWYRDPFIRDTQQPLDEMALDALQTSPLQNKQVTVRTSRNGAVGRLVVTSVFAQGYTVDDVACADANGSPPCTSGDYDHEMVFSFSAPKDQDGHDIVEGQEISGFAGGISEFNGLTEVGFPQTFVDSGLDAPNQAREPQPVAFDPSWFMNKIMFERNEAGAIAISGAKVCKLDADYDTYKQWKIDPAGASGTCTGKSLINVITTGIIPSDVIEGLPGMTLPKVVGILRPVSIGSFNVWIIYPRSMADLTLP